jgi:hypothetical protein
MHVVAGRSHQHELRPLDHCLIYHLCINSCFLVQNLEVFIAWKLIVFELFFNFIKSSVSKLSEQSSEIYTHIWMVMQMHLSSLFNEEKYQTIVVTPLYNCSIEVLLKIFRIRKRSHPHLLRCDFLHLLYYLLTTWFIPAIIKKSSCIGCFTINQAHCFDTFD